MPFFEDNLAKVGRGLDAGLEWCADRWRAMTDRGRHSDRFDQARDRAERAREAAVEGVSRFASDTRERWLRHDVADRDSMRRVAVWGAILAIVVAAGVGVRVFTRENPNPYSDRERDLIVQLKTRASDQGVQPSPGMAGWRTDP